MKHMLAWLLVPLSLLGADIKTSTRFAWTANDSNNLAGYFLHFGPTTGFPTGKLFIVASRTNISVPPLPGKTFYTLTAVNNLDVESLHTPPLVTTNDLIITLTMEESTNSPSGPWRVLTNQVWVASGGAGAFYRGRVGIVIAP